MKMIPKQGYCKFNNLIQNFKYLVSNNFKFLVKSLFNNLNINTNKISTF